MQAMWILTKPISCISVSAGFIPLNSVRNFSSIYLVFLQGLSWLVRCGINETMPTPFGLSTQWYSLFVFQWKSLKPGNINRKRKFAVTYTQWRQRIEFCIDHFMPFNEGFTINRFLCYNAGCIKGNKQ